MQDDADTRAGSGRANEDVEMCAFKTIVGITRRDRIRNYDTNDGVRHRM